MLVCVWNDRNPEHTLSARNFGGWQEIDLQLNRLALLFPTGPAGLRVRGTLPFWAQLQLPGTESGPSCVRAYRCEQWTEPTDVATWGLKFSHI